MINYIQAPYLNHAGESFLRCSECKSEELANRFRNNGLRHHEYCNQKGDLNYFYSQEEADEWEKLVSTEGMLAGVNSLILPVDLGLTLALKAIEEDKLDALEYTLSSFKYMKTLPPGKYEGVTKPIRDAGSKLIEEFNNSSNG
jgi:hypothetical protein